MKIQLPNFTMAYDDTGQGIPVLLIHGYPLNRTMWQPQFEDLKNVARLIAIDLRGHGESEITPGPYSMDMLADDCLALLEALELRQPVVLCGLSMGGYISFAFYRRHPSRVAGLILTATRAVNDSPDNKINREKAAKIALTVGTQPIIESMLPLLIAPSTLENRPECVSQVKSIMETISPQGMAGDLIGMRDRLDSTPLLGQIRVPALIIAGVEDQLIPAAEVHAMQAAIPTSKLVLIPQAGHLPNLEQPELFNQSIRFFLERI